MPNATTKLLAELNGALLVRTDLGDDIVFAWFGGRGVHMLSAFTGETLTVRTIGVEVAAVNHITADGSIMAWAREMA